MSAIVSAIQSGIRSIVGSALTLPSVDLTPEQVLMAIFAGGAKGAWYERGNLSSLYQEPSIVTPVSAAGQLVGRGLSRDQGLTLGPELVTNGGFDTDSSWAKGTGWSISGGMARISGGNSSSAFLTANLPIAAVVGATYRASFDYTSTSGRLRFNPIVGGAGPLTASGSSGRQDAFFVASGDPTSLFIQAPDANSTVTVDNVSVRRVFGNHQIQATAGLRPIYQAGPSRLVFDGTDDVLNTTFPAALGAACTVGRSIPGAGAVITTGVNVGANFADGVTAAALVIIDRALTAGEAAALTAYLNQQILI